LHPARRVYIIEAIILQSRVSRRVFSNRDTSLVPARRAALKRFAWPPVVALPLLLHSALAAVAPRIDLDAFEALKKSISLPDGESLAYLSMGAPAGPAVVLIHGYTDSARDWVPLLPYLSPRWRLLLIDVRGHGSSGKPECCYTRLDFAYDIKLLLDALRVPRADIVGHSMGSIIAQTFAEYWPERTRRVVLISSSGGPRAGAPPHKPAYDYAAQIRQLKEPLDPDSHFMIEWWSSPTPVDADFIRRQRRDARVAGGSRSGTGGFGSAAHAPEAHGTDAAHLGQRRSHHGGGGAPEPA
jgi:pimeloyl-ACP methyl ester carboxylesterase